MNGQWIFGYLPYPDMAHIGFLPNQAAAIKILACGAVRTMLINTMTLVAVSSQKVGPAFENLDFFSGMLKWNAEKLQELIAAGMEMYFVVHKQHQVLYIPQGWIAVEMTEAGQNLVYGFRKSFMMSGRVHTDMYEGVLRIFRSSGRKVDLMEDILNQMRETT